MANGQVTFVGINTVVYLPTNADVKTVVNELKQATRNVVGVRGKDTGDLAAEFVRLHANAHNTCRLANIGVTNSKYTYIVDKTHVTVYDGSKLLVRGELDNVLAWTDASVQLRNAVDKVVRFVYKGGSGTRERLVKVTGIEGTGNGTVIRGWDVHKSKADSPAYRCYRVGNIVGNVEVVG